MNRLSSRRTAACMWHRQFTLEQHNACGQTAAALTIEQADAPFAFSALPNTAQEIEAASTSPSCPPRPHGA